MSILRLFCFISILIGTFFVGATFFLFTNHWIDISVLEHYNPGRPSIVLDDEDNEWARFQLDRRKPVSLQKMPPHLINAFVAAEDWTFFSHYGLSIKSIFRSIAKNLYYGRKVQGGSTITQQLVKLLFFDSEKTFTRKLKEQLYALIIEQQFTKEQILEIYLNHVYFGCGIYGVEAASQRFWGKTVSDLTIDQAASLAAIIRNPAQYCPLLNPLSNERRRNIMLHSMFKNNFISSEEYKASREVSVQLVDRQDETWGAHVKEMLRLLLEELVGKDQLYSGGLTIKTTINKKLQITAEASFEKKCRELREYFNKPLDGGLIAMEVSTGEIRAIVGGVDFKQSQYNRAIQARRQLGSVFKPVVYAAAIEKGMSFADVVIDEPIEIVQEQSTWAPKNYDCTFNGPITRAYALSHSNNMVTIKTLLDTGVHQVIDVAKRCRLSGPYFPYPSLALGCIDATVKEAVGMFNVFANDGVYVEPHCIKWIKDKWGSKIYKQTIEKERALASQVSSQVAKVLGLGINRAKNIYKDWIESEAISKTGTTNDSRTCWYIGSTPTLTTAVYIGCDDNQSMGKNVYPIRTAFPIWLALNKSVVSPIKKFSYDPSLQAVVINEMSGQMVDHSDPDAIEILV